MKPNTKLNQNTQCVHAGNQIDQDTGGVVTPIFPSTAYAYMDHEKQRYPRYFNIPNQEAVIQKVCALEGAESGVLFGSGMAAISTALLAHLKQGDHVVFQKGLYGGTTHFVQSEFENYGIQFDFTTDNHPATFEQAIRENTKLIFIETPSNPLLEVVDIRAITAIAKTNGVHTLCDNTFASPVNQRPIELGVDLVMHSATKYLGGHSDISAGLIVGQKSLVEPIQTMARSLGGSLNAHMCYLLERSIKTLVLRVNQQNSNALKLALFLDDLDEIARVNYPGLESHPNHEVARSQMSGFGGMLSFELREEFEVADFQKQLRMIYPAQSLGGVESTIAASTVTSHAYLTEEQKRIEGISDQLLRLSVGIEDCNDLILDITQAIQACTRKAETV